jgi:hypothetical protein
MHAIYLDKNRIQITLKKGETFETLQVPDDKDAYTFVVNAIPGLLIYDALLKNGIEIGAAPASALGYALWSALTRDQIAKLDAKDSGRLMARANDQIPETNPVIVRLAQQAGLAVTDWFAAANA